MHVHLLPCRPARHSRRADAPQTVGKGLSEQRGPWVQCAATTQLEVPTRHPLCRHARRDNEAAALEPSETEGETLLLAGYVGPAPGLRGRRWCRPLWQSSGTGRKSAAQRMCFRVRILSSRSARLRLAVPGSPPDSAYARGYVLARRRAAASRLRVQADIRVVGRVAPRFDRGAGRPDVPGRRPLIGNRIGLGLAEHLACAPGRRAACCRHTARMGFRLRHAHFRVAYEMAWLPSCPRAW